MHEMQIEGSEVWMWKHTNQTQTIAGSFPNQIISF